MVYVGLFFLELILLFLLARALQKRLSYFFYSLIHKEQATVKIMAFIFFPGTVLHEFAHAGMAHLLMVPVGTMSLTPQIDGKHVRLGSVAIGKTDPLRRLFIGVAPFLVGNAIILGLLYIAQTKTLWTDPLFLIIALYTLFQVGNTMFSSRRDLEGAFSFILILTFTASIAYLLGLRISAQQLIGLIPETIFSAFQVGSYYLLIPLGIDIAVIIFITVMGKLFSIER